MTALLEYFNLYIQETEIIAMSHAVKLQKWNYSNVHSADIQPILVPTLHN